MKYILFLLAVLVIARTTANAQTTSNTQTRKTENLIVIGWDGVRWQEIYTGVDSAIMTNHTYTRNSSEMRAKYWAEDVTTRREKLLPFFWGTLVEKGQLYGNRTLGSKVDVANRWHVTLPGFTETLIGFADSAVDGNHSVPEKDANVLEFINNQAAYKGKVAVFATSKLYDNILNVKRSGLIINCDSEEVAKPGTAFQLLNEEQRLSPQIFGERLDLVTYFQAKEYLKEYHPRVLYINFSEPDNYAHAGSYDWYISTLHGQERLIADLWNYIQSIPQYKDKTTLLISNDHGRGDKVKSQWTSHGPGIQDSKDIFILAMGPDLPSTGEMSTDQQLYQGQVAATLAKFLGLDYVADHPVMPPIPTMFKK